MFQHNVNATSWLKLLLYFGFTVIVLLMTVSLFITINSATDIKQQSQLVHDVRIPQTVNLLKLEQDLNLSLSHLNTFLISSQSSDKDKFYQSLQKVETKLDNFTGQDDHTALQLSPLIKQIKLYKEKATQVVSVNNNQEENYIGITKAAKLLNPLYREFGGILEQLIADELAKEKTINLEFLSAAIDTRNSWYHFIMSLRVYFLTQGNQDYQNVDFYLQQTQQDMQRLGEFKKHLDFEAWFIRDLEEVFQQYQKRLPEVLSLYKNEQWRHDIYMLKTQIYPLMSELSENIRNIVSRSERLTGGHIADIRTRINDQVGFSKWIFLIAIILAVVIVYFVIKHISLIAHSLEKSQKEASHNFIKAKQRAFELELAGKELNESLTKLKATQEQLIESEKMAALGGLVAGVAHEINTPLGICVTSASCLHDELESLNGLFLNKKMTEKDFVKFMDTAIGATTLLNTNHKKAADLIKSFKQIAVDQTSEEIRSVNLKQYLDEIIVSLGPKYREKGVEINVLGSNRVNLNSYPGAISQIISQLLLNSINHAFEGCENARIKIEFEEKNHEESMLCLTYGDNGCGMSQAVQDKIFEPFYTTKRADGGSGIGMALVYNLVTQRLGGSIEVKSEPNHGTQFDIVFPINISDTYTKKVG